MLIAEILFRPIILRLLYPVHHALRATPRMAIGFMILAISAVSILPSSAHGQSTFGSIRGIATDSTGAAIPGTQVVLHSVEENTDTAATTDADGTYLFNNVKPGQYVVTVAHTGFSTKGRPIDTSQSAHLLTR